MAPYFRAPPSDMSHLSVPNCEMHQILRKFIRNQMRVVMYMGM